VQSSVIKPALGVLLLLACAAVQGQTAYRYRDAQGQWVFSDTAPSSATASQSAIPIKRQDSTLHITLERRESAAATQLVALSNCLCVVTFKVTILHSDDPTIPDNTDLRVVVQPRSEGIALRVAKTGPVLVKLQYIWKAALGSPRARHNPPRPYRIPFAIGSTYEVAQAYPMQFTHNAPDSRYAVDITLPDGTPIYAARDGVVINVRTDAFVGAAAPVMMDQANVVEILHDDGTIGVYAHLHEDSVRVHIGQQVARGMYIADSGNTGFTTGPHLHFAVLRNSGDGDVSIPVEFAGSGGLPVVPVTRMLLTAY
jgi:murein DD-endopeptidase MepM/ murein hydrolase activator NlpD